MRKLIAIMDILDKDGKCIDVGCRHEMVWAEGEEKTEKVCQDCMKAVKTGKELRAQLNDRTGEIIVILG